VHADVLESDLPALAGEGDWKAVANIPYYITSPIIRHLLEASRPPALAVLMVQKEVAERICAKPGDLSLLAVSVQYYASPELLFPVPASAFSPVPKVDSAVLRLTPHANPLLPGVDADHFFKIVRAGFSQRRKQLANSLSGALNLPKPEITAWLAAAGITPERRAETLTLEEWGKLSQLDPGAL
jgi:16S rRNA (adenine1518-N6/adenine1519-N6)-dimethyltransferase